MAPLTLSQVARDLARGQHVEGTSLHESCRFRFAARGPSLVVAVNAGRKIEPSLRKRMGWTAKEARSWIDTEGGKLARKCPSWLVPDDHHRIARIDVPRETLLGLAQADGATLPISRLLVRHDECVAFMKAHLRSSVGRYGVAVLHLVEASAARKTAAANVVSSEDADEFQMAQQWVQDLSTVVQDLGYGRLADLSEVSSGDFVSELLAELDGVVVIRTALPEALVSRAMRPFVELVRRLDEAILEAAPQVSQIRRGPAQGEIERVDDALDRLSDGLDVEPCACPINRKEAKHRFLSGGELCFEYASRIIDTEALRCRLHELPLEQLSGTGIDTVFRAKAVELDRRLDLFECLGRPMFLATQMKLFGRPRPDHVQTARELLSSSEPCSSRRKGAARSTKTIREDLEGLFGADFRVKTEPKRLGPRIGADCLILPRGIKFRESEWDPFLAGLVPAVTVSQNGMGQRWRVFANGFPGWEGYLPGWMQYWRSVTGRLSAYESRRSALLAIGADAMCAGADPREVFERLTDWGETRTDAYALMERLFWGGGWLPEAQAFGHSMDLRAYFAAGGDLLPLICGTVTLDSVGLVSELLKTGALEPPSSTPFEQPTQGRVLTHA